MKLILFDVDGTLVAGRAGREAMRRALVRVYDTAGAIEGHDFAGKTDPQIARDLLRGAGLADEAIDARLSALWGSYLAELGALLRTAPMRALPGVGELLDALAAAEQGVALGLVTGNIAEGARLKLRSAGLDARFPIGGYGSDAESRDALPPIAIRRAGRHWGTTFAERDVVLVGDTPLDIASGRVHGLRTVGVATGRHDAAALWSAGAGRVFADLSETERVLAELLA